MQRGPRFAIALTVLMIGLPAMVLAVGTDRFPQSVASGDPMPDSVVLWTRVNAPEMPDALRVEVATDFEFTDLVFTRDLTAEERYDFCVKVRATGLQPYTTYYYRFVYGSGAAMDESTVGRTRTAPAADSQQPPRFAVVYCQDYVGRYYNSYLKLLRDHDDDIDFVIHLGDYIYETTGDPTFQDPSSDRLVEFEDTEGAILLGSPGAWYHGAASLSNYRTLYRTYKDDPVLQQVHERWPMIVIWDDHEFSNDSWQATANYFNGRVDENDEDRKRNSEQAFFEWVPTEVGLTPDGLMDINASILYPNSRIYRDYQFGSLLHLALTDFRNYRPDHLIPEDALPGEVALDEPTLRQVLGDATFEALRGSLDPYIDIDAWGAFVPILQQTITLGTAFGMTQESSRLGTADAVRLAEDRVTGNIGISYINALYDAAGLQRPFADSFVDTLPRGLPFMFMGKTGFFTSFGSRSVVLHDSFNLYAAVRYALTAGAAQEAFGAQQTAWLQGVLTQSPSTWKILGNSVMMTPLVLDFTNPLVAPNLPPEFPDQLRTRIGLIVEDFNGFPQKRMEILGLLSTVPNSVVISGDIHATFVTDHQNGVYEFTGPAISSSTLGEIVGRLVSTHPIFGQIEGIEAIVQALAQFLQISTLDDVLVSPSDIAYADTFSHGFMVVEATADALHVTLKQMPSTDTLVSYYDNPAALDEIFTTLRYTVQDGQLTQGR